MTSPFPLRPLCDIAGDILDNWRKYSEPTAEALLVLRGLQCCFDLEDKFHEVTGKDLVMAFLRIHSYTWVPTSPEIEPFKTELLNHLFWA